MSIATGHAEGPRRTKNNLPRSNRRMLLQRVRRSWVLYLLLLPTLAGMFLFQYLPAGTALWGSFHAWNGRQATFVGLNNFEYFFEDPRLIQSWENLAQLLGFGLISVITMPLLTAYLIYHLPFPRHQYIFRVLLVIPIVVPGIVNLLLWRWIYSLNGALNRFLEGVGLENLTHLWLGDRSTALYAIMFVGFPFAGGVNMLIYLAGFLSIPSEIMDAAAVDGARGLRRFLYVELPLIRGQVKLLVMLTFIGTLQQFERVLVMTNGGPGWTTMVPGLTMYEAAMSNFDLGYASSIGLVLFIIIFTLTLINQRFIQGSEDLQY